LSFDWSTGVAASNMFYNTGGIATVRNCIFYGGSDGTKRGGIYCRYSGSKVNLTNCILLNLYRTYLWGDGGEINANYCCIYNMTLKALTSETNIISGDPLLQSPGTGNFRLQSGSPCIDTGLNVGLITDFAKIKVPHGTGVDVGLYEFVRGYLLSRK